MKKLIFLVFPLAFFIGFMPYFFDADETQITSAVPKIVEEKQVDEEIEFNVNEIQKNVDSEVELLALKCGIIENATVLTNNGIENI